MTPLITNPLVLRKISTENLKRWVEFLDEKKEQNTELMSREDLIQYLSWNGYIKRKFKIGWE